MEKHLGKDPLESVKMSRIQTLVLSVKLMIFLQNQPEKTCVTIHWWIPAADVSRKNLALMKRIDAKKLSMEMGSVWMLKLMTCQLLTCQWKRSLDSARTHYKKTAVSATRNVQTTNATKRAVYSKA